MSSGVRRQDPDCEPAASTVGVGGGSSRLACIPANFGAVGRSSPRDEHGTGGCSTRAWSKEGEEGRKERGRHLTLLSLEWTVWRRRAEESKHVGKVGRRGRGQGMWLEEGRQGVGEGVSGACGGSAAERCGGMGGGEQGSGVSSHSDGEHWMENGACVWMCGCRSLYGSGQSMTARGLRTAGRSLR